MIKPAFLYVSILLIVFALFDIKFEWRRKVYLFCGLMVLFCLLALDSAYKQRICARKQVQVSSIEELCRTLQPGDVLGFDVKTPHSWFMNVLISSLAETYYHQAIVMEHNGQKYIYHSYTKDVQEKRIEDGDSTRDHIVGEAVGWNVLLEPLENYLNYMDIQNSGNYMGLRVLRSGVPITYSSEIKDKTINNIIENNTVRIKGKPVSVSMVNCCVFAGEYLLQIPNAIIPSLPYHVRQFFVFTPLSLKSLYPFREHLYYRMMCSGLNGKCHRTPISHRNS
jgi:hypothetical protein